MKLKSIADKFIKGYVVLEEVSSKINGQIKVDEDLFGNRRLLVGGLTQSGTAVKKIWESVISNLPAAALPEAAASLQTGTHQALQAGCQIANCLILGLGAGNAAKIVNKYFPEAKIIGVEIDPEIIKLGNKYFGLKETGNLKIEIEDAFVWVSKCSNDLNHDNSKFDLVLVDLYIGDCFPEKAEEEIFLLTVKKLLSQKGLVIFNRLYFKENIQKANEFQKKIQKIYTNIEAEKTNYNKLFLCRK